MQMVVVTPVRNGHSLLQRTMNSVLNQSAVRSGRVQLHYVVQDGQSADDTVALAQAIFDNAPSKVHFSVVSEPDSGMYEALGRGFLHLDSVGDWFGYVNAGDVLAPNCFETIADFAEQTSETWICGLHAYFNDAGSLVHTRLPPRFVPSLIRSGAYGRGLPTLQQESTFWSARLQQSVDWSAVSKYRIAGDAYLWWTFASQAQPAIVQSVLGGFTYHGDHLGKSKDEYRREISDFAGPLPVKSRLRIPAELILWEQPARVKARLNPHLYLHDIATGVWRSQVGAVIPTQ
jgi:glycosyltransferase involved in cell wall biosynthesis